MNLEHEQIVAAIKFIRPNIEFVVRDKDLEFFADEQTKPSMTEIEAGWIAYQEKVEADKATSAAKRQALLDKLGITEDEAKLLLGGN